MTKSVSPTSRTENLKVRMTPDELHRIDRKAKAARMARSRYIRTALAGAVVQALPEAPELLREQNLHLARIGNNLNQLARHANSYRGAADAAGLAKAVEALQVDLRRAFDLDRDPVSPQARLAAT